MLCRKLNKIQHAVDRFYHYYPFMPKTHLDALRVSLRYCPFCGEKLVGDPIFPEITHESTMEMLNHKAIAPKMKFWTKEEGRYVGIDNTAGDFKTKDFSTKEECLAWLAGENTAAKNSPRLMG